MFVFRQFVSLFLPHSLIWGKRCTGESQTFLCPSTFFSSILLRISYRPQRIQFIDPSASSGTVQSSLFCVVDMAIGLRKSTDCSFHCQAVSLVQVSSSSLKPITAWDGSCFPFSCCMVCNNLLEVNVPSPMSLVITSTSSIREDSLYGHIVPVSCFFSDS